MNEGGLQVGTFTKMDWKDPQAWSTALKSAVHPVVLL
jgi:hypothetical protein